jgi:hypothetical protein
VLILIFTKTIPSFWWAIEYGPAAQPLKMLFNTIFDRHWRSGVSRRYKNIFNVFIKGRITKPASTGTRTSESEDNYYGKYSQTGRQLPDRSFHGL